MTKPLVIVDFKMFIVCVIVYIHSMFIVAMYQVLSISKYQLVLNTDALSYSYRKGVPELIRYAQLATKYTCINHEY